MEPVLLAVAGFCLGLVGQGLVDYQLAKRHTIPRLRELVKTDAAALLAAELDKRQPGAMRGGVDPVALNERKQQVAEERRLAALKAKVEVKTFIAERFGEERVAQVEALLGPETMEGIYQAGERWKPILAPMLARMKPLASNDAKAERTLGFTPQEY